MLFLLFYHFSKKNENILRKKKKNYKTIIEFFYMKKIKFSL